MKRFIAMIALSMLGLITIAQKSEKSQSIKYVTEAPDGSIAMTITDEVEIDRIKVESAVAFYEYQILDKRSNESVYTSKNAGKDCSFDKTGIKNGTYDLRLYTLDFVITTDLEILKMGEAYATLKYNLAIAKVEMNNDLVVALND